MPKTITYQLKLNLDLYVHDHLDAMCLRAVHDRLDELPRRITMILSSDRVNSSSTWCQTVKNDANIPREHRLIAQGSMIPVYKWLYDQVAAFGGTGYITLTK